MILNCRHSMVVRQISHPVDTYLLSSVEIPSLRCSEKTGDGKQLWMQDAM